jgi:hypothetical protein
MLNLFFKRAILFLHTTPEGMSKRYNGIVSGRGPVPVPDWVKETLTYKHGVKAGDILDLTPPGKAAKKAVETELKAAHPGKTEDEIADAIRAEQPPVPVGVVAEGQPTPAEAGFAAAAGGRGKGKGGK